ncbi:MAG: long-chain fatty acid--CoA ligase [Gammaproteobacteria bacterium]|nr:long-chain fatty acid--CoA ligase [Gammaproteobacteria bacterium]
MNLSHWIERQAGIRPEKCAIRYEGRNLSYAEVARKVDRLADALRSELDVTRGDRVAYLGLNSPELLLLLFACARVGAILLPLNWRLARPEYAFVLKDAEPKCLFVEPEFARHVEDIGRMPQVAYGDTRSGWISYDKLLSGTSATDQAEDITHPDDPVLLCYTSGTTGKPKGALLSNDALLWNAENSTHMHDLSSEDVVLTVLPMFHVGGLNIQTMPALRAGATVVLHRRFEPEPFFDAVEKDGITLTLVVPTVVHALADDPRWETADFSKLRMMSVGSTIVPEEMVRALGERSVPLVQVYGSTETAPIAAYMPYKETMQRPASTGKPAKHCEIRLVDEEGHDVVIGDKGEILVRGPNVMTEYWNDPEATAAAFTDGWLRTGDIAHYDNDGFLYVDGRSKDMIISGGENVYPAVIEKVLNQCPDLSEVAVIGRPDDYWGEVVVAVVVPNGEDRDAEGVLSFCEGRIAQFEMPREVIFVDQLPRNAMGKVVKEMLHETVLAVTTQT